MSHVKRNRKAPNGQFAAIPHAVLKTRKYASLDGWGVKLLLDLMVQYNGKNNGDLSMPWSVLKERGWRSKGTMARAERSLREVGFIIKTRFGGKHHCNLYAITWQPINECISQETGQPKHDCKPTLQQIGGWKDGEEAPDSPPETTKSESRIRANVVPMRANS